MKRFEAQFFNRENGDLVTYRREVETTSKAKAQAYFKDIAKEYGWRLVQFYEA